MSELKELQYRALVIANHYDDYNRAKGRKTWDLNDYTDGLVGDVGDLMKLIMGARNRRNVEGGEGVEAKIEHELNDIMFSLLLLYKVFRLDPDESFLKAMDVLEKRVVGMKAEFKRQAV
jgi:hypothetical protein